MLGNWNNEDEFGILSISQATRGKGGKQGRGGREARERRERRERREGSNILFTLSQII